MVVGGVVGLVEVDAEHDGHVGTRRRCGDHDLLGAGIEVLGGVLTVGEEAGRLDHDVSAELSPGKRARVALGEHPDLAAVHRDTAVGHLDGPRERAVVRVVLEQVRDRLAIDEVVQREPLDVRVALDRRPEHVPADSPKSVDADSNCH